MANLLEQHGGQPQKQPKYAPIFVDRMFTGIWTQRSVLHDPSDIATARFYGGRPDALWLGSSNIELTNRLTLQRRPGLVPFSEAVYPTPPQRAFSFELTNGTIQVIVDTGSSPSYQMAAVDEISKVAYYYFYSPQSCAANNALAGLVFTVTGFDNPTNNGSYVCVASTSTYLILSNPNATTDIANSSNATAITTGGVYYDPQIGGIKYLLFAKGANAGQTGFVSVAGVLYAGDGVDTWKYTPGNTNGTIANGIKSPIGSVWNYSIAAPTAQPSVVTVESGAAAVAWQASTFYSTMGLLVDGNGNIEFLTGVNNSGTNTTQYGLTGQGQPIWSNVTGVGPISGEDGTCNWLCAGPLSLWIANTKYIEGACIYIPGVGGTPVPAGASGRGVNFPGTTGGGIFQAFPNAGTSGSAPPKWNPVTDTHTTETTGLEWQYLGPAQLWEPQHVYNAWWEWYQMCVVEPSLPNASQIAAGTQTVYVQTNNNATTGSTNNPGTSGTGYTPPWPLAANTNSDSVGQTTGDGDLQWICLGWGTWLASTEYVGWTAGATQFSAIVDGNGDFQVAIQGGLSGSITPLNGWLPLTHYALNSVIAVRSASGWVEFKVTTAGTTGANPPTSWNYTSGSTTTNGSVTFTSEGVTTSPVWGQTYGAQTTDGGIIWVNVGSAADSTWKADTQWYLPAVGFAAPTSSQAYGGAEVIANGDVQIVISSGLSGSSPPSWEAIGTTTQDNQAVWYTDAAQSIESLSWTSGYVYAYSYKSRASTDFYSVTSYVPTGPGQSTLTIPIPPGSNSILPPPTGSETEGISTASPTFTITGANSGAVNFVTVTGSLDPQVDTIVIWRSTDGGGAANMFELTEIPNPAPVNGAPGVATFADFLPDVATTTASGEYLPGLDQLITAPINDQNDPPPSNFVPNVYNFQRIWGYAGQELLWSGGPDITNGSNANEAYNPANNFPYLANLVRIIKNSQGLVIFTTDSVEFLGGGPQTQSFYTVTLAPGIGMNNFNAADLYAGEIFFFSSDSQLKSINPSLQLANVGFPIGDQLALIDSDDAQVAIQQAGIDNAIYVADGSTGWWRCNPHQIPGGASGPEPIWSPFASITNGCHMVQSVEVSPGTKKLLVGTTSSGAVGGCYQILERDINVYTDNGTPYDAYFVMGAIMLCHQGQVAVLDHVAGDFSGPQYFPTVSYLVDEISGNFTTLPNPVYDPPALYSPIGTTSANSAAIAPTSYSPLRWYFRSSGAKNRCRFIQLKIDFGTTSNGDEIYNLCIYGRLMVEL